MTTVSEQQVSQAMELYPTLWVKKYGIKTSQGLPLEFDKHAFLYDPMNDMSPFQAWLKPPQIGASETIIIKVHYCAKKKDWDIIYTLPTASDVEDMAANKINRIIAQNPILKEWVKEHDTVDKKYVGERIINFRGTFSQKQAMMVSSNLNVHDEVDASDENVIVQYETRQKANEEMRTWYFSHPSIAGKGVDIPWQKSDKKEWFITCPLCNDEHYMTFPDSIDFESQSKVCKACKNKLSDETIKKGVWKATSGVCRYDQVTGQDLYPNKNTNEEGLEIKDYSGYHISQMMCSWISAKQIIKDWDDVKTGHKTKQHFWNMVLGLPYADSDEKVYPQDIYKNVINELNRQEGTIIIGVDTGLPIHYMLMNEQGAFFHGECDNYDELDRLMVRYPKSILVSDQGGDLIGIRQLQEKYRGRVFLCYYRQDRKSQEVVKWGKDKELGTVIVDRNRMLQLIIDQLKDGGRIKFNGTVQDWKPLADHFGNMYRITEETPFGNRYVWERNGPDHKVHTLLYSLVGFDRFGVQSEAQIVHEVDLFEGIQEGRIFNQDYSVL